MSLLQEIVKKLAINQLFQYDFFPSKTSLFEHYLFREKQLKFFDAESFTKELIAQGYLFENEFGFFTTKKKSKLTLYRFTKIGSGAGFLIEILPKDIGKFSIKKEHSPKDIYVSKEFVDYMCFMDGDCFYSDATLNNCNENNFFFYVYTTVTRSVAEIRLVQENGEPQLIGYFPSSDNTSLHRVPLFPPMAKSHNLADNIPLKEQRQQLKTKMIEDYIVNPGKLGLIKMVRDFTYNHLGLRVKDVYFEFVRSFNNKSEIINTINGILGKFGLENEFPDAVVQEAASFGEEVPEYDTAYRKDLTHLNFCTIDGEDARDFDDAVYCQPLADDKGYKLFVAIADVSYYVRPRTKLDKDAQKRSTSIYFPVKVVPMLPEELSNGLCSINPNVKRFTMVAEMDIDLDGQIVNYDFYQACIISKKRFTYNAVQQIIDSEFKSLNNSTIELNADLKNLYRLYKLLTAARDKRGSVVIDSDEPKFRFDEQGNVNEIYFLTRHDSHKMIEELMIIANVAAAKFIDDHEAYAPNRNHELPSVDRINNLNAHLARYGLELPIDPTPQDYRYLAEQINQLDTDRNLLNVQVLRSLPRAVYETESKGHFGLALEHYAQFTSPIRRYPDLLLHRVIKSIAFCKDKNLGLAQGAYEYSFDDMESLCSYCSDNEFKVEKAGYDFLDWIKCKFISKYIDKKFEVVVSTVNKNGAFVTIPEYQIDGFLPFSNRLKSYQVNLGQRFTVEVANIKIAERRIEFCLPGQAPVKQQDNKPKYSTYKRPETYVEKQRNDFKDKGSDFKSKSRSSKRHRR